MGEIDLGLDFVGLSPAGTRGFAPSLRITGDAEMGPHLFRFVFFQGAGMGLLLSNSNLWKCVEN